MVFKTKTDQPIEPIRNAKNVSAWLVPEFGRSNVHSFHQSLDSHHAKGQTDKDKKITLAEEVQSIKDAAYQEGLELGRQAGIEAAKQQTEQQATLFNDMLEQLSEPLSQIKENTQQELLKLAFAIARQIVRRELKQDPTQLIAVIREALKLLPIGAENIVISMHPEDAVVVKKALAVDDNSAKNNKWLINGDPAVERGGCQINTANSKIDGSIDKQIAVLFSNIAGGQRAGEKKDE